MPKFIETSIVSSNFFFLALTKTSTASPKFKDLLSIILYISTKLLLFFMTYSTTSKPIDLAEPLTISIAPSISAAFKSFILFSAISFI